MAMNKNKVSIIIPVYNVEKYIEQCATSLFEQTYNAIEYIFVNDASTDDTMKYLYQIVSKYPHRDIKILNNKTNRGSSASRVLGIEQATGEYITFCDSDDYLEINAIQEYINEATLHNSDVVVSAFYTNTFDEETIFDYKNGEAVANLNNIPISFKYFALWNKLFRTSLIMENLSLDSINCWEDLSMVARIYAQEPKVTILNTPLYHYRKYEYNSLTSASHERQLNDRLKYTDYLLGWFEERGLFEKYEQFLNHLMFTSKIKMLRTKPRQYSRWKHTYPEANKHIMSYSDIPLHYRLAFFIANIFIQ